MEVVEDLKGRPLLSISGRLAVSRSRNCAGKLVVAAHMLPSGVLVWLGAAQTPSEKRVVHDLRCGAALGSLAPAWHRLCVVGCGERQGLDREWLQEFGLEPPGLATTRPPFARSRSEFECIQCIALGSLPLSERWQRIY